MNSWETWKLHNRKDKLFLSKFFYDNVFISLTIFNWKWKRVCFETYFHKIITYVKEHFSKEFYCCIEILHAQKKYFSR